MKKQQKKKKNGTIQRKQNAAFVFTCSSERFFVPLLPAEDAVFPMLVPSLSRQIDPGF
jgi:hypothetical protein